ncbi:hypothetical protein CVT26_013659 [Gymnopilus dilepis]|uniref:Uncharacterized protein n=1 Tax=Gymnopilus dilepis TaxID=231916 RepID=A0A409YWL1_9AGAR|nr:hypothetical protein CVT26_013659 [Gymnopilus dilepis]
MARDRDLQSDFGFNASLMIFEDFEPFKSEDMAVNVKTQRYDGITYRLPPAFNLMRMHLLLARNIDISEKPRGVRHMLVGAQSLPIPFGHCFDCHSSRKGMAAKF